MESFCSTLPLDEAIPHLYPPSMKITRRKYILRLPDRTLLLGEKTLVMGILNVTPDSFSDGGRYNDVDLAVGHALEMERQGADLIDIGAESTRPGSRRLPYEEELHRLVPVLERLRGKLSIPISVDTYKSEVAERALKLGAGLINDVSGGSWDPRLLRVAKKYHAPLVLMHMRGTPETWKQLPPRRAVVQSTLREIRSLCERARGAGISRRMIIIDPGIGFGKNADENLKILGQLDAFAALDMPVCVGTSRKSFLGGILPSAPPDRLMATAATVVVAALKGVHIVRVHDVEPAVQVVRVTDAIRNEKL